MYLWDGGGGNGSNGDIDDPGSGGGSDGDIEDPGGGGGSVINPFDKNNDGFIDCYQNTIMRVSGLFISSDCNVLRIKPDGTTYLHNAWDITGIGVDGQIIYSASDGIVLEKGYDPDGWGYYVKIKDKEGNIWIYAHLKGSALDPSGLGLAINTEVTAGVTPIGICDNSGDSRGPHLHLELQINGQKTCPDAKIGRC